MLLAPTLGEQPREIAEKLAERLRGSLGADLEKVEVAGPGFLNLFLADAWYRRAAAALLAAGEEMGRPRPRPEPRAHADRVRLGQPDRPADRGGGRHAAYGDSVGRALEFAGHPVQREYYVNDRGGQIDRFAESIAARMTGGECPRTATRASTSAELAERLGGEGVDPSDLEQLGRRGRRADARPDRGDAAALRRRVRHLVLRARAVRVGRGGAGCWPTCARAGTSTRARARPGCAPPSFGDDKDRVLIRSEGESTYYLADIAYHRDKLERSGGRLLDVLGADHHGYMRAAARRAGGAGAGPRAARVLDHAARPRRRGRRARADVEAQGRVRDASTS